MHDTDSDTISNVTHTLIHSCYSTALRSPKVCKAAVSRTESGHGDDLLRLTLADSHLTFLSTIPGHPAPAHTHISVGQYWIRSLAMKQWTDWTWTNQTQLVRTGRKFWKKIGSHFMGITISIEEYSILYFLQGSHSDWTLNNSFTKCQGWLRKENQDYTLYSVATSLFLTFMDLSSIFGILLDKLEFGCKVDNVPNLCMCVMLTLIWNDYHIIYLALFTLLRQITKTFE